MAATKRIANDLITQAYLMLGSIDAHGEVEAFKINTGLYKLNISLDKLSGFEINIPIYEELTIPLTANKGIYTIGETDADVISKLEITALDYSYIIDGNTVRALTPTTYKIFYANGTSLTSNGRPRYILFEKFINYSKVSFYPLPDTSYNAILHLKKYFDLLENQDILNEIPVTYHKFLTYDLARDLSGKEGGWTAEYEKEYMSLKRNIEAIGSQSLTVMRRVKFENHGYTDCDIGVRSN